MLADGLRHQRFTQS